MGFPDQISLDAIPRGEIMKYYLAPILMDYSMGAVPDSPVVERSACALHPNNGMELNHLMYLDPIWSMHCKFIKS